MGWRCSVNLYLPPANVGAAMLAVRRAVIPSADPPCAVTVPGGKLIHLPFAPVRSLTPEPVVIGRKAAWFDVALRVPTDDATDEWWDDEPFAEGGGECIALDALHLTAAVGDRYAGLSFSATTGAASSVLFESRSAHAVLLGVLREAGAGGRHPDRHRGGGPRPGGPGPAVGGRLGLGAGGRRGALPRPAGRAGGPPGRPPGAGVAPNHRLHLTRPQAGRAGELSVRRPRAHRPMSHIADLKALNSGSLAVGWLEPEHPYTRGVVPPAFVARLREFARRWGDSIEALGTGVVMGYHTCGFCGKAWGSGTFGVPAGGHHVLVPGVGRALRRSPRVRTARRVRGGGYGVSSARHPGVRGGRHPDRRQAHRTRERVTPGPDEDAEPGVAADRTADRLRE
jgi:hypothetical protein